MQGCKFPPNHESAFCRFLFALFAMPVVILRIKIPCKYQKYSKQQKKNRFADNEKHVSAMQDYKNKGRRQADGCHYRIYYRFNFIRHDTFPSYFNYIAV